MPLPGIEMSHYDKEIEEYYEGSKSAWELQALRDKERKEKEEAPRPLT